MLLDAGGWDGWCASATAGAGAGKGGFEELSAFASYAATRRWGREGMTVPGGGGGGG